MKYAPHMRRVRFSVIRPADQIVYVDVEIVRKQPQAAYARFLFATWLREFSLISSLILAATWICTFP